MASISKSIIANMALGHVGHRHPVEDLDTDSSPEANECRLWYDYARFQVLEAFDWTFARKRISATLHADTVSEVDGQPYTGTWGYRYRYPDNCVKVRKVQNPVAPPDDAIPFAVELSLNGNERTVLTNQENAVLVYTFDQEVTELFSPAFVSALSHLIGHYIAFSVTGKRSMSNDMLKKYQQLLPAAGASDANEGVDKPPRDAEHIRARS